MAENSTIEWTEATWNPVTGCDPVSSGCNHCYARRLAYRLKAMGNPSYANGFDLTIHPELLDRPLTWKRPRRIFVNSMSDLFHKDIPFEFIRNVFSVMEKADWHIFQILTKRTERLKEFAPRLPWPKNVWIGATVESDAYKSRIEDVSQIPAAVRFLSLEPLLTPMPDMNLENIDWVIVGGESGPGARQLQIGWVEDVLQQCLNNSVPFFFKQWGGTNKKKAGRSLNGKIYSQMPPLAKSQLFL